MDSNMPVILRYMAFFSAVAVVSRAVDGRLRINGAPSRFILARPWSQYVLLTADNPVLMDPQPVVRS